MMKDINTGKFTIQIGLILRDSIFVSKMLLNSEVWHNLTQGQINELEKVDRILLRHTLNAHSKTGIEWLYHDTGKLDLGSLIKIRRLMYLWHILSRHKSELIRRIYTTQKITNSPGDWVRMVDRDKQQLDITMTDSEIQGVSKQSFKSYVTKKVKNEFMNYLKDKKRSHKKSEYLDCQDIKPAEYIQSPRLSHTEKLLLFKLRSRTLDVKQNFKNQHRDPWCLSCGLFQETQSHLLQCPALVPKLSYLIGNHSNINENDIYGSLEKQETIVKVYRDLLEMRENLQNTNVEGIPPPLGGPSAQLSVVESVVQHR